MADGEGETPETKEEGDVEKGYRYEDVTIIENYDGTRSKIRSLVVGEENLPPFIRDNHLANPQSVFLPRERDIRRGEKGLVVSRVAFPQEDELPTDDMTRFGDPDLPRDWLRQLVAGGDDPASNAAKGRHVSGTPDELGQPPQPS